MADEPQRHRIVVACPECGHSQAEPALVVSTQCRACRANFQVVDGKGVSRSHPVTRLAKPRKDDDPEPPPPPPTTLTSPTRFGPSAQPERSFWMRLFRPAKPAREVICFACKHPFKAIAEAQSSQCPKCGSYINLADYDVTQHTDTRIHTRGNVVIRKTGTLAGTSVYCHHLTVLGALAANVECSGDLVIRSHGKIPGTIKCRHLRVEKGARVEFLHPVTAVTATINGEVRGQISCSGGITLEKRARFHGLIRAADLIVKSGARHTGTVERLNEKS